jgi:hypothetical protein
MLTIVNTSSHKLIDLDILFDRDLNSFGGFNAKKFCLSLRRGDLISLSFFCEARWVEAFFDGKLLMIFLVCNERRINEENFNDDFN